MQAGVIEIGEIASKPCRESAEPGDGRRRQMLALRQRPAREKAKQPNEIILFAHGDGENVAAVQGRHDIGHTRRIRFAMQMTDRGILRLKLDQLVFGVADLQHIGIVAGIDTIVAILLAAELGQRPAQAVMRLQDLGCFLRRHVGSRQLHTVYERGVGHGIPRMVHSHRH